MTFSLRSLFPICVALLAAAVFAEDGTAAGDNPAEPASQVQAALRAEMDGDTDGRQSLLAQALQGDPKHPPARWHSGYVQVDDRWVTVEDAEFSAVQKGVVATYREMKKLHSGNLAGELLLARWCRGNGLTERERLHWSNVLQFDPSNREARSRLRVREYAGRLMTVEQIETYRQAQREYDRALQVWNPRLRRWRREIESAELPSETAAWRQLASVDDPHAVPSLELVFPEADADLQRQFISVLGNIEDQVATDALVRLSLVADSTEIRGSAATQLGQRSWFAFIPNLLGRLQTPIECRYLVQTLGAGVFRQIRFTQENPSAVVNVSRSFNAQFPITILPVIPTGITARRASGAKVGDTFAYHNTQAVEARRQRLVAQEAHRQYRRVLESLQQVQLKNAQVSLQNERVYYALRNSTGQDIQDQPQLWWQWWRDYNELAADEEKPEIEFRDSQHYEQSLSYRPRVYQVAALTSCFAAGTAVWTELGPVAIENVQPGDRVLAQDPESGQVDYRIVLDTTIRPPSPTLQIDVAGEQILATLGHPVWVVGQGWRMVKELNVGDRLHGLRGGVAIDKIESGPAAEAYNLVVADTKTYFIGKHRLLVHDNTIRRPFSIPIPGWQAEEN